MLTRMSSPEIIAWDGAAERIRERLALSRGGRAVLIVGITGPVGAGKTTLARAVSGCVLSTDRYLPDYEGTPPGECDLPERADLARLAGDLSTLRAGQEASVPCWSFHEHRRTGYEVMRPAALIACEGIHALHAGPAALMDLKVFVEASRAVRWARWEAIERAGERGMGVEAARSFFDGVAEPSFAARAEAYRAAADVIVVNG